MRIRYRLVRAIIVRDDLYRGQHSPTTCPLALSLKRMGIELDEACGVHHVTDSSIYDVQLSYAANEFVETYDGIHLIRHYDSESYETWLQLIDSMPFTVTVFVPEVRWQTQRK